MLTENLIPYGFAYHCCLDKFAPGDAIKIVLDNNESFIAFKNNYYEGGYKTPLMNVMSFDKRCIGGIRLPKKETYRVFIAYASGYVFHIYDLMSNGKIKHKAPLFLNIDSVKKGM